MARLARPAFIASAASTIQLQTRLLNGDAPTAYRCLDNYLEAWKQAFGQYPDQLPTRQSFWDRPGIDRDKEEVAASLLTSVERVSFSAASNRHSGDWLFALPVSSCGLQLDDDAVRVAVGLRLGLSLCEPHVCPCGSLVDSMGTHSFLCKHSAGRLARHQAMNKLLSRAFNTAEVPVALEPAGLDLRDGKRPDGLTLVPWESGRSLAWDFTAVCPFADSWLDLAAQSAELVVERAAERKAEKYADLSSRYIFQPIAVDILGSVNASACELLEELGRRIAAASGDERDIGFLFQRFSLTLQRFNSVLLHEGFSVEDQLD